MLKLQKIIFAAAICFITLSGCSPKQEKAAQTETNQSEQSQTEEKSNESSQEEMLDLNDVFNGIHGCAVLYSPSENKYSLYHKAMAMQEVSPYSTFKIISALIGLHNDIIEDENSVMNYNGTEYPNPEWNENLTLKEAFQTSCIWYFRQIIDSAGEGEVKKELNALAYGNCDVSAWGGSMVNPYKELNGFWLGSSLKISPYEQVKVLSEIFEGESFYDSADIEILKEIMLIEDNEDKKIYGKTGSGTNGEAWFTGFTEEGPQREYFAVYIDDSSKKEQISSSTAKEIAFKILE